MNIGSPKIFFSLLDKEQFTANVMEILVAMLSQEWPIDMLMVGGYGVSVRLELLTHRNRLRFV